jgi:hypothetical protein
MVTSVNVAVATESAVSAETASGQQSRITANPQLPPAIQVDETKFKIVATMRGTGKQVYDCVGGAYAFREPTGVFTNLRAGQVGIHGAGPFWASFDGSKVIGTGAVPAPSPDGPGNIAWLKLSAASTAGKGGVFSNVAVIQRTDTRGDVAPTTCGAPTVAVSYTTAYVFWAPK